MPALPLRPVWLAGFCAIFMGCEERTAVPAASSSAGSTALPPASASAGASQPAPTGSAAPDPSVSTHGIRWAIGCSPAKLTMSTRGQLQVEIAATNETKDTADAKREHMRLSSSVGGKPGRFFGNGHHDKRWRALPAGETVKESYALGTEMLLEAGDITITVESDGAKATCVVRVDL